MTPEEWLISEFEYLVHIRGPGAQNPGYGGYFFNFKQDHAGCHCDCPGALYAGQTADTYWPFRGGMDVDDSYWCKYARIYGVPLDTVPFQGYVA